MKKCTNPALAGLIAAAVAALAASGCASDLDTTREPVSQGSFGETLVSLLCKRMAYVHDLDDSDERVDVRGERYRAVCRGTEPPPADAPDDLRALLAQREQLAAAIDAMWPEPLLPEVQAYATSETFLAAYDQGTVTAGIEALRGVLLELAGRPDAAAVLERLSLRRGYTPASSGAIASILSSPDLRDVLLHTSGDIAPGGRAHDALTLLAAAVALELRHLEAPADPADPERSARMIMDLLLTVHGSLITGTPMLVVVRDHRGIAEIAPLAPGALPQPYVDEDGDGLADVDELGRYVDASGQVIDAPSPFPTADADPPGTMRDPLGRALETRTSLLPLYRYIDLDGTLLAALARDAAALVDPDRGTAIDLLRGVAALLGPRVPASRAYEGGEVLEYTGFDTAESPLLDLIYASLQILRDPEIYDTLALVRNLLEEHEDALAQLSEAFVNLLHVPGDLGEAGDRATLEADSALMDDLAPVLQQIIETPGLLEDLLKAMEDPRLAQLGPYFRDYMTHADQLGYDPETQEVVYLDSGEPATELVKAVDREAPDSGFNRSIFQRVLHLLADTNGLQMCNKQDAQIEIVIENDDGSTTVLSDGPYDACELLQVDNLAVFYVQSLAYLRDENGNFVTRLQDVDPDVPDGVCDNSDAGEPIRKGRFLFQWKSELLRLSATDPVMELATGIDGFTNCPQPQALNRTLFLSPRPEFLTGVIDPPTNRFGVVIEELHRGTLPGWELGEFYDLLQPLAQPFVDHGAEQLFVDIMVVLHDHWPSRDSEDHQQDDPEAGRYAYASNLASFEPIVAEILDRGLLLQGLVDAAPALNQITVNGKTAAEVLRVAGRYLLAPRPGLTTRDGATSVTRPDGTEVDEIAPWHLLVDALADVLDAIEAAGERGEAFEEGVSEAADVFLRAERDPDTGWHFRNPRVRDVGLILVDFLVERLQVHDAAGDRDAWLSQELPADIEELLAGPMVAGASDMVDALAENPEGRRAVEGLLAHALDEARDPAAFRAMVAATTDALQLVLLAYHELLPLADALGLVVDPARGWLDPLLAMASAAGQADTEGVLAQTLRNLFAEHQPGRTPIGDIVDAIGEVQREQPFEDLGERYTAADYQAMLRGIAGFLGDEKRGLPKFIAIIQGRNAPE